ncbi:hypothetical protein ABK040_012814 [Willaertia magna]
MNGKPQFISGNMPVQFGVMPPTHPTGTTGNNNGTVNSQKNAQKPTMEQGGNNYNRKQEGREGEEQSTRPTHFFAVRINAPTILSDIMKWQKNLLEHHNSKQQGLTKASQQGLKQNISSLSASSITSSSYSNNNNENKVFKLEDYQIENSRMHLTLFVLNCGEKEELELTETRKGIKRDKKVNDQLHCTLLKTSQVRGKYALRNLPEYVYEYENSLSFR